ncbi:MAG: DNA/RNA non-specific endonuclease [Muribaculaceae bacterium]|nr:DNA/RNA non-specific endonuclease [Muribaculaceae bacterium]
MGTKSNSRPGWASYAIVACLLMVAAAIWAFGDKDKDRGLSRQSAQASELMRVGMPTSTDSRIIDYEGFTMSFNDGMRQPNWVAWELTRDESQATEYSRGNADFAPDPAVGRSAQLDDYRGSGYDRGHMCPAGDMRWSLQGMKDCFLLTNMSPQKGELNSGAWKSLEEKCREWAVRDSAIIIICGPVLTDRLTRSIGSGIPVPERYFKVILAPYADPVRGIGFIMPNARVKGGMQAAAVSIDEVEAVTGFDFFAALPDDVEDRVEAECNFPRWSRKN